MVGLWAEDSEKIYIEFEKRGELFSMVPSFKTVDMKDGDIDHDLSTEDKEDLKWDYIVFFVIISVVI